MRIAIVGCGFVADSYMRTLKLHAGLELIGAMDLDRDRAARFAAYHKVPVYSSLDEVLKDSRVEAVLNLTNPSSHYTVSRACLNAGKHVYSEKPLTLRLEDATELVELGERNGVLLSSAPCTILSETAQTIWKALRKGEIGRVRLVYAEMDEGMLHRAPYEKWISKSGAPWPYKDEFEVGCTLEHASYSVSWLAAFFGPAKTVSAFSSTLISNKQTDIPLDRDAPDFSVACIQFASGTTARLTCSIVAPRDHSMKFIGDEGILWTEDSWRFRSPVYIKRTRRVRNRLILGPLRRRQRLLGSSGPTAKRHGSSQIDFCRGVAELADAIRENRESRLSAAFCLHVTEVSLAIDNALEDGTTYTMSSSFDPIEAMPWASS